MYGKGQTTTKFGVPLPSTSLCADTCAAPFSGLVAEVRMALRSSHSALLFLNIVGNLQEMYQENHKNSTKWMKIDSGREKERCSPCKRRRAPQQHSPLFRFCAKALTLLPGRRRAWRDALMAAITACALARGQALCM